MSKKRKTKKSNKKKIAIIVVAACLFVLILSFSISAIISTVNKKKADKTVRIAFYGISTEFCDFLKEKIPQEEGITVNFDILSEGFIDLGSVKEKYDMIFTWKGEITDSLENSAEVLSDKIIEVLPSSLKNQKCVPILLDNCELTYSKDVVEKLGGNLPTSFPEFLNYLNEAKNYVFSPFFCNGAEDRIIAAFVGNVIEVLGGVDSYDLFIDELRKETPFEELLDKQLSASGLSLRSVLDMIKTWSSMGYAHPAWFNAKGNDLVYFAEEGHVGVFYTFLSQHRRIQYNTISKFDAFLLPPASSTIKYGIMAPGLCLMLLSENANAKRYSLGFFTQEAQEDLSEKTKLAPVHVRAQAYDRQADDVRYWAASTPAGALPDLALAAYQRNPDGLKKFTDSIRNYIK